MKTGQFHHKWKKKLEVTDVIVPMNVENIIYRSCDKLNSKDNINYTEFLLTIRLLKFVCHIMKKSLDKLTFIAPKINIGRQPVTYI